MSNKKKKIGEVMLSSGLINDEDLNQALEQQALWGKKLGESLIEMGTISEEQLASVLGQITQLPAVDLRRVQLNSKATEQIPLQICLKYGLVPIDIKNISKKEQLVVAFSDPLNIEAIEELRFLTEHPVFRVVATKTAVTKCIETQYQFVDAKKEPFVSAAKKNEEKIDVQRFGGENSQVRFDEVKAPKIVKMNAEQLNTISPRQEESQKIKKTIQMLLKTLLNKQVISKTEMDLLENILE